MSFFIKALIKDVSLCWTSSYI